MMTIKKMNSQTMRPQFTPSDVRARAVRNGHLAARQTVVTLAGVSARVWALDGLLFALLLRLVVWGAFAVVVGDAVGDLWRRGHEILAVVSLVFFPVTFVVWPWLHEAFGRPLWLALVAAVVAQSLSFTIAANERATAAFR